MSTTGIPLDDDELLRRQAMSIPIRPPQDLTAPVVGPPSLKTNTPATLPPVGVPPSNATKPAYEQQSPAPPMSEELGAPKGSLGIPRFPSSLERQGDAAKARQEELATSGSGVSQIQNPFLHGLARVADVIGSIAAPRVAAAIPGTTLHHQLLQNQNAQQVGQLENEQGKEAETGEREAQTANANSEIAARANPKKTPEEDAYDALKAQGQDPATAYGNVKTAGQADQKPSIIDTPNGPVSVPSGKTEGTPITVAGQPVGPKGGQVSKEQAAALNAVWDPISTKQHLPTGAFTEGMSEADAKELANNLRASVGANQREVVVDRGPKEGEGTFSLQEGADGKLVLFNNKTGESKSAPAGVQPKGTYAKTVAPIEDAKTYANDYLARGTYTGPGDEALQEKFFELAKPTTGFRMTQPQINQLKESQDWLNSAKAKIYHAVTGTWFSDEQREQIVGTMNELAEAKEHPASGQQKQPTKGNSDPLGILK